MADVTDLNEPTSERDDGDLTPAPAQVDEHPVGDVPPEVKSALKKANEEAKNLRLKLKEYEDRDKTETERLTERLTAAERERDEVRTEALRLRIAHEKGLTPRQAARLRGSSEEELTADADALLEEFGTNGPRRPTGDVGQGPRDTATAPTDPKSLADAVIAQRGY